MLGDELAIFQTDRNTEAIRAALRIMLPQILKAEVVHHIFLVHLPNIVWSLETVLVRAQHKTNKGIIDIAQNRAWCW